jgi:ketosteroid isomerase-like protein
MRYVTTAVRWRVCGALAGALLVSSVLAGPSLPNDALPADLLKAAQEYDEAQLNNDGPALMRLLGEDLVLISSSGRTESKSEFIGDSTTPGFRLEPFTILEPVHKVMGDTAILGGVVQMKGTDGGKPFSLRIRFSDIWHKREGRWQVVYIQVTRLPSE